MIVYTCPSAPVLVEVWVTRVGRVVTTLPLASVVVTSIADVSREAAVDDAGAALGALDVTAAEV